MFKDISPDDRSIKEFKTFKQFTFTNDDSGSGVFGLEGISGSFHNFQTGSAASQSFGVFNEDSQSQGKHYTTFYSDGTWSDTYDSTTGTWGSNMGNTNLDACLCSSKSIDIDLWLTFEFYNTYYYWDLESTIGSNSIEGYHDENYNQLGNVDGITSLTLYNATLHGDMDNLMNQNTSQNPAYFKNIKNNEQ